MSHILIFIPFCFVVAIGLYFGDLKDARNYCGGVWGGGGGGGGGS